MNQKWINHNVDGRYRLSALWWKSIPLISSYAKKIDELFRFPMVNLKNNSGLDTNKFSFSYHEWTRHHLLSAYKTVRGNFDFIPYDYNSYDHIDDSYDEKVSKYATLSDFSDKFPTDNPRFYADWSKNFVLWYDLEPLCFVSFEILWDDIVIYSLQGIWKGRNGKLENFDWQNTLLSWVEDYARLKRVERIGILSWEDNYWNAAFSDRADRLYDNIARKNGYLSLETVEIPWRKNISEESRIVSIFFKEI